MYSPADDGKTHINIYSRSKSLLGRKLSNFNPEPVCVGSAGLFKCLEGYWYWLRIHLHNPNWFKQHHLFEQQLREARGFDAKRLGRLHCKSANVPNTKECSDEFKAKFKVAMRQKLLQHQQTKTLLLENNLPLQHYYIIEKDNKEIVIPVKTHLWQLDYWQDLKEELKFLK